VVSAEGIESALKRKFNNMQRHRTESGIFVDEAGKESWICSIFGMDLLFGSGDADTETLGSICESGPSLSGSPS
jgi:hypothetical protein